LQHNIPILQPENIKKSLNEFIKSLENYLPIDFGVVVAFGQILPKKLLELPKFGCINIHGSILPRWRGAAPMQRAIMSGDKETGVAIMQMGVGLDTGPVYDTKKVIISDSTTLEELHNQLSSIGADALIECLPKIYQGEFKAVPQEEAGITYANKILPEDTRINWQASANTVSRQINGLSPFPGAYCELNNNRLKIFKALPHNEEATGSCGTIGRLDKNHLWINCQTGMVELLELQLAGKKRLNIGDFLRGTTLHPQDKLI
jgi:methionyl-tRNA formyltransferase